MRCVDNDWQVLESCTFPRKCEAGACVLSIENPCEEGKKRCVDSEAQECVDGIFQAIETCESPSYCDKGECHVRTECEGSEGRCMNDLEEVCNNGFWETVRTCDAPSFCRGTTCQDPAPECSGTEKTCNGKVPQSCQDGVFVDGTACTNDEYCEDGACHPKSTAQCSANDPPRCIDGERQECTGGDWVLNPCPPTYTCLSGTCQPPQPDCTSNDAPVCSNNKVRVCENGSWVDSEDCGSDRVCSDGQCKAPVASCSSAHNYCANGRVVECVGGEWQTPRLCGTYEECNQGRCEALDLNCGEAVALFQEECHPGTSKQAELQCISVLSVEAMSDPTERAYFTPYAQCEAECYHTHRGDSRAQGICQTLECSALAAECLMPDYRGGTKDCATLATETNACLSTSNPQACYEAAAATASPGALLHHSWLGECTHDAIQDQLDNGTDLGMSVFNFCWIHGPLCYYGKDSGPLTCSEMVSQCDPDDLACALQGTLEDQGLYWAWDECMLLCELHAPPEDVPDCQQGCSSVAYACMER